MVSGVLVSSVTRGFSGVVGVRVLNGTNAVIGFGLPILCLDGGGRVRMSGQRFGGFGDGVIPKVPCGSSGGSGVLIRSGSNGESGSLSGTLKVLCDAVVVVFARLGSEHGRKILFFCYDFVFGLSSSTNNSLMQR